MDGEATFGQVLFRLFVQFVLYGAIWAALYAIYYFFGWIGAAIAGVVWTISVIEDAIKELRGLNSAIYEGVKVHNAHAETMEKQAESLTVLAKEGRSFYKSALIILEELIAARSEKQ